MLLFVLAVAELLAVHAQLIGTELAQVARLHSEGMLTVDEFRAAKAHILGEPSSVARAVHQDASGRNIHFADRQGFTTSMVDAAGATTENRSAVHDVAVGDPYAEAKRCFAMSSDIQPSPPIKYPPATDIEGHRELDRHFEQILLETAPYKRALEDKINAGGYTGPWLEDHWVNTFAGKPRSAFGPYIPLFIPWTNLEGMYGGAPTCWCPLFALLKRLIRPDLVYITVVQSALGPAGGTMYHPSQWANILVLSAGGYGHVPLPLIKQRESIVPENKLPKPSPYLLSFAGAITNVKRTALINEFKKEFPSPPASRPFYHYPFGTEWREVMINSSMIFAPRGFGRTTYKIAESIQMGLTPVYWWDDVPWLPYNGTRADFSKFGFSASLSAEGMRGFAKSIANVTDADLKQKRDYGRSLIASHFTQEGVMSQIASFMLDATNSDLRCTPHPRCPLNDFDNCNSKGDRNQRDGPIGNAYEWEVQCPRRVGSYNSTDVNSNKFGRNNSASTGAAAGRAGAGGQYERYEGHFCLSGSEIVYGLNMHDRAMSKELYASAPAAMAALSNVGQDTFKVCEEKCASDHRCACFDYSEKLVTDLGYTGAFSGCRHFADFSIGTSHLGYDAYIKRTPAYFAKWQALEEWWRPKPFLSPSMPTTAPLEFP
jgi:hypothetical protein